MTEPTPTKPLSGKRVAALVANDCVADSRVIKQAESLVKAGADVTVFCVQRGDAPQQNVINGVTYQRYPLRLYSKAICVKEFFAFRGQNSLATHIGLCLLFSLTAGLLFAFKLALALYRFTQQNRPLNAQKEPGALALFVRNTLRHIRTMPLAQPSLDALKYGILSYIWRDAILAYKPDIIHAHDFNTVAVAVSCKQQLHCPLIYDAHEIEADRERHGKAAWQTHITHAFVRKYIQNITALITVNESARDYYITHYGLENYPTAIIYNSPDAQLPLHSVDTGLPPLKEYLGLPHDTYLLSFTGAIGGGRSLDKVVRAMKPIENLHLSIMGPRREEQETKLRQLLAMEGMQDRVHILPPVHHSLVPAVIKDADMGICFMAALTLNNLYCSPNKLFEMAIAGLPMIVSDLPELTRIVKATGLGITSPRDDVAALTENLRAMLSNLAHYRPDEKRLHDIQTTWGWPAQAARLASLYQTLLH